MSFPTLEAKNAARLALAVKCIDAGNLAAANVLCCNVLDHEPRSGSAYNLLGIIGTRLRLWPQALAYFRGAIDRGVAEAQSNFQSAQAEAAATTRAPARERFLLIKAWGAGFWSDVSHVLGGLVLAEVTGRTPVIHWGRNSCFTDGTSPNAFPLFFEPISNLTVEDLKPLVGADFFPRKWNASNLSEEDNAKWAGEGAQLDALYFLDRPETVLVADFYISIANFAPWIPPDHPLAGLSVADLYRHAIGKYFRPRQHIIDKARAFFEAHLTGAPYVAVHLRGSDKVGECTFTTDSEEFLSYITGEAFKLLDQIDRSCRLFLMTDDERIAQKTIDRYGTRIVLTPSQRTNGNRGVHFLDQADGVRLGIEVMIDVFIALQAPAFIGFGGSNVAAMVALLRDWPEKRCVLIGPSILLRRGQMPYLEETYRELERPDFDDIFDGQR